MRVSDTTTVATQTTRIMAQRSRIATLQEQLTSGKRLNRASDDPAGTEAVLRLRNSAKEVEQFSRAAHAANQKLTATDDVLTNYTTLLDRMKMLIAQGMSDTGTPESRFATAQELSQLKSRVLNIANSKYGNEFLFGGTRQSEAPFDGITGVPSTIPATAQYSQIEPGANAIATGDIAENIFSDATSTIFTNIDNAITALNGTGDPVADRAAMQAALSRMDDFSTLAATSQVRIGVNMQNTTLADERMTNDSLSIMNRISEIEDADFAKTAVELVQSNQLLEATLQIASQNRRSLLDFLA